MKTPSGTPKKHICRGGSLVKQFKSVPKGSICSVLVAMSHECAIRSYSLRGQEWDITYGNQVDKKFKYLTISGHFLGYCDEICKGGEYCSHSFTSALN